MKSKMTEADKAFYKKEGIILEKLAEDIGINSKYEYWYATYKKGNTKIVIRITRSTKHIKFMLVEDYYKEQILEDIQTYK